MSRAKNFDHSHCLMKGARRWKVVQIIISRLSNSIVCHSCVRHDSSKGSDCSGSFALSKIQKADYFVLLLPGSCLFCACRKFTPDSI